MDYKEKYTQNFRKSGVLGILSILILLLSMSDKALSFQIDPERGVLTLAPVLKTASRSIVRIQLDSRRWKTGKAGPGGIGSGFVVDSRNGYILTNHHVIQGARRIYVFQNPGRSYRARIVGKDKRADIAVLKIDTSDLPQMILGNSDTAQIGDLTVAVGFPFGLGRTSSMGIISSGAGPFRGRYDENKHSLQIDAAINPGNSGGPFLNSKGEVIGVNTSIMGDQGGTNLGIGFGVPINVAVKVLKRLVARRNLPAPRLIFASDRQMVSSRISPGQDRFGRSGAKTHIARSASAMVSPKMQMAHSRPMEKTVQAQTRQETLYEYALKLFGMKLALAKETGKRVHRRAKEGAYVVGITKGSISSLAGLVPGDEIVMVGNARVFSAADLVSKLHDKQSRNYRKSSAKSMRIVFRRGAQHYETFLKAGFKQARGG